MAPIVALAVKLLLPVLVTEAQKKISAAEYRVKAEDVSLEEAAPVAVAAAAKSLISSKTVIFSVLLAVLGAVEAHTDVLGPLLGHKWGWVLVAIGGITAVLRTITTTSLVEKAEPKE